jgi:hypothetical protein
MLVRGRRLPPLDHGGRTGGAAPTSWRAINPRPEGPDYCPASAAEAGAGQQKMGAPLPVSSAPDLGHTDRGRGEGGEGGRGEGADPPSPQLPSPAAEACRHAHV